MRTRISAIALVVLRIALANDHGLALPHVVQYEWQWAVSSNLVHEPVVGLLDVPNLIGNGCGSDGPASLAAYASPSSSRPPSGSIMMRVTDRSPGGTTCASATLVFRRAADNVEEVLPTDESGYEVPALVVYQRSGPWFRVALQRGSTWVRSDSQADFQPYPELLQQRLAYLRKDWDGRLRRAPGGAVAALPREWRAHLSEQLSITVLGQQQVGSETWIHVRLDVESCGVTIDGVSGLSGWIPSHRADGTTSAWFHSRGC